MPASYAIECRQSFPEKRNTVWMEIDRYWSSEEEAIAKHIACVLYYETFILRCRNNMELSNKTASDMFKVICDRHLNRINASKYLFFTFSIQAGCVLMTYNKDSTLYSAPTIGEPGDANFDFEKDYFLRILSGDKTSANRVETIYSSCFLHNSSTDKVVIYIGAERGLNGHVSVELRIDPTKVKEDEESRFNYLRDLWSVLNGKFYDPVFYRAKTKQSALSSKASTPNSPVV